MQRSNRRDDRRERRGPKTASGWAVRALALSAALAAPILAPTLTTTPAAAQGASFPLTSPAFVEGGAIPKQHTCDGANTSPPLKWMNPPANTKSFALIVDDPDAPSGTFVHWVAYGLPAQTRALRAGASGALPPGASEGLNGKNEVGWTGPCPPQGRHRYFHRVYALDAPLEGLGPRPTRAQLERAMQGHVLGTATIMGTYERGAK